MNGREFHTPVHPEQREGSTEQPHESQYHSVLVAALPIPRRAREKVKMSTALLAVVLLPLLGAAISGFRAFARPHTPKSRTITNVVTLGVTALSAIIATFGVVLPYVS